MNNDTTSVKTLAILYGWFCDRNGFPTTLVSDNGPQFKSQASNGLAEKAVGIFKTHLKKMDVSASPIELYTSLKLVCRVLNGTPNTSTGLTPFELMNKAPALSMFPQLQPDVTMRQSQEKKQMYMPTQKVKSVRTFGPAAATQN